jgi:hypothetical protein
MDGSTRSLAQRLRSSMGEGAGFYIRMATFAFADFSFKAEDKVDLFFSFDAKFA